ncbi:MAG: ABC transporter permease [Tissierellia bacterium]|nr:ABC transporter permease [Tissierellia bacterium]
MSFGDLFSMALRNLLARKLRTFLTALGVLIGTVAIVVMTSFGFGLTAQQEDMVSSFGDLEMLDVMPGYDDSGQEKKITKASFEDLKSLEHVASITPVYSFSVSLKHRRYENMMTSVEAVDADAFRSWGYEMASGSPLKHDGDIVFGSNVVKYFYDPRGSYEMEFDENGNYVEPPPLFDPQNAKLEIINDGATMDMAFMGPMSTTTITEGDEQKAKSIKGKVTGVMAEQGNYMTDQNVFISTDTYRDWIKSLGLPEIPKNTYNHLKIQVDDGDNVRAVENKIKEMGYEVQGLLSLLDELNKFSRIISAVFAGIGSISFVVAAIGITNTMIMSIYERTREIGVMKVIGASIQDIQRLFLVEAGMIGLFGGIMGLALSLIISMGINNFARTMAANNGGELTTGISIIPWWMLLIGLAFSTLIGVASGYLPARRAMRLSALDAIRSE